METIKKINADTIEITRTSIEMKEKYLEAKKQLEAQVIEEKNKIDEKVKIALEKLNEMLDKFK